MPVRDRRAAALATPGAAAQARHLGGGTGFIDEDQPDGVEVRLGVEPGLPADGDVRSLLLAGVCCFYGMGRPTPLKR